MIDRADALLLLEQHGSAPRALIDLDPDRPDDSAPFVDFRCEQSLQLIGGRAHDHIAGLFQLAFDHGIGKSCDGVEAHFLDDFRRRLGRHEQAVPRCHLIARYAGLRHGRQFRRYRVSVGAGNRESTHLARSHVVEQRATAEIAIHAPRDEIAKCGRCAAIGLERSAETQATSTH